MDETALYYACEKSNIEIANKLIDHGANVDLQYIYKQSPLQIACYNELENLAIKIMNKSKSFNLEELDPYNRSIIWYIYHKKLDRVLKHVKLLYRNSMLESSTIKKQLSTKVF